MLNFDRLQVELKESKYKGLTPKQISDQLNEKVQNGPVPIYEVVNWVIRNHVELTGEELEFKFFYSEDIARLAKRNPTANVKALFELQNNRFTRAQLLGYYWLSPEEIEYAISKL